MRTTRGWLLKRGTKWSAVWNADGRRYVKTTGTSNETRARQLLREWVAPFEARNRISVLQEALDNARIRAGLFDRTGLTLAGAWAAFLASPERPDPKDQTMAMYEAAWARFLKWAGDRSLVKMSQVSRADAVAYATKLAGEVSGSTFNRHLSAIRMVWRALRLPAGLTAESPWDGIRRKKTKVIGRRALSLEELQKVIGAASGEIRTALMLGTYTGLRLGDVARLRWPAVDLDGRRIQLATSKTGHAVHVPIHPALAADLAGIRKRGAHVLPELADRYESDPSGVAKRIRIHLEKCGFTTRTERKGGARRACVIGFHSLRHSFVSLLRQSGASLLAAEKLVGHSSPEMTRQYSHEGDGTLAAAIAGLPAVTEAGSGRTPT